MGFLRRESSRRRTRNFDLDAASRGNERSRLARAFTGDRLVDTLFWFFFAACEVTVMAVGVRGLDAAMLVGLGLLVGAMNVGVGLYVVEHKPKLIDDRRQLLLLHTLTLLALGTAKLFVALRWPILLYPLGLFAMVLSISIGQRVAIFWTTLIAAAAGLMKGLGTGLAFSTTFDFPVAATLAGGSILGILILGPRVSRRRKVIRAGICMGVAFALMTLATDILLHGHVVLADAFTTYRRDTLFKLGFGFLNGLFTGYFMVEFGLRIVEDLFDVVTDMRLQELADLNQPILKKFSIEAPGTFHHSQMVGTLAEAAAESVDANPLLCRVGAHFHDIGKMAKPEYYIENITAGGPTKHDGLTPRMSTLIIVSHVKDGIEMAEELGLPQCVIGCIPQHHGTIAVEYFFHQAVKLQKKEGGPEISKDDFRYPGPRPQCRETAILMIADSVEAISRVLTDPNPTRIADMVHDVVLRRLNEGQFDECAITLAELKRVEDAMVRVLMGIFHGRIRYPKAATVDRMTEADTGVGAAVAASLGTGITAEDTGVRIRAAALAADGPGVPQPEDPPVRRGNPRF